MFASMCKTLSQGRVSLCCSVACVYLNIDSLCLHRRADRSPLHSPSLNSGSLLGNEAVACVFVSCEVGTFCNRFPVIFCSFSSLSNIIEHFLWAKCATLSQGAWALVRKPGQVHVCQRAGAAQRPCCVFQGGRPPAVRSGQVSWRKEGSAGPRLRPTGPLVAGHRIRSQHWFQKAQDMVGLLDTVCS